MKYYKNIENGYIVSVSTEQGLIEITKAEYDNILCYIKYCPISEPYYEYKLRENLTWDRIEKQETFYEELY